MTLDISWTLLLGHSRLSREYTWDSSDSEKAFGELDVQLFVDLTSSVNASQRTPGIPDDPG